MRRLVPLLTLITACATTSPKRSLDDLDIDVLWEQAALPTAAPPTKAEPAKAEPQRVAESGPSKNPPSKRPAKLKTSETAKKRPAIADKGQVASEQSPALHTSNYHLTWQGKRIGEAREVFHRSASGVRIIRHEEIRITRGGVPVDSETEIIIHADKKLRATRVELRARAGAVTRRGQALRADDGSWVIALEGESVRKVSKDAVPLELVPYLVGQSGDSEYHGTVLLAGYGFAVTTMRLEHDGRQGRAILATKWGEIATDLRMSGDGSLMRASTGATGSIRVGEKRLHEKFRRAELPGQSSIPLTGSGSILVVENVLRQPPPAVGAQSISLRKKGWRIQFETKAVTLDRRVRALVHEVDALLTDSHDAPGASAGAAMALGRGDCTAHATLLVDLATEQNIQAKLVTGFRIDESKLVRHRWVTIKQGKRWVHVDPTFGEAPVSPGKHLALAIHGDSTAQIALVDEAVFSGLENAKAKWVHPTVTMR